MCSLGQYWLNTKDLIFDIFEKERKRRKKKKNALVYIFLTELGF